MGFMDFKSGSEKNGLSEVPVTPDHSDHNVEDGEFIDSSQGNALKKDLQSRHMQMIAIVS